MYLLEKKGLSDPDSFISLGIPTSQVMELDNHVSIAQEHVFGKDQTAEEAIEWLVESLTSYLEPEHADLLMSIVEDNYSAETVEYLETGYDSCQEHRQLSKIVSEAILIGGLIYEGRLLGLDMYLDEVQILINSKLELSPDYCDKLVAIAKNYGGRQDFIFPGVTASSEDTPSIEQMAYNTLSGKPDTSVRTLTGLGGVRFDKDWNHVADLVSFVGLKITEDKRYYPGVGIFYFLMKHSAQALPAVQALEADNPALYKGIIGLQKSIRNIKPQDYEGVSVLCASYVPKWQEMKQLGGYATRKTMVDLANDFHSPSFEFAGLKSLFEGSPNPAITSSILTNLESKLNKAWSFNSTIHLPWTSRLATLSNVLMGRVTNQLGDHATRYGIAHEGKSLEIIEYNYGAKRRFPAGLALGSVALLKIYPESELFEGRYDEQVLLSNSEWWTRIKQSGFLKVALSELESL